MILSLSFYDIQTLCAFSLGTCIKIDFRKSFWFAYMDNPCHDFYSLVTHILQNFCWDSVYSCGFPFESLAMVSLTSISEMLTVVCMLFVSVQMSHLPSEQSSPMHFTYLFKISFSSKSTFPSLFFTPSTDPNFLGLNQLLFGTFLGCVVYRVIQSHCKCHFSL